MEFPSCLVRASEHVRGLWKKILDEIQKDKFDNTGPKHLKADTVDWKNADHRRSVTASLVQGVYVLENDRHRTLRKKPTYLYAEPWWQSFNFQLHQSLKDNEGSIFGAVYKYINVKCSASDDSNVPRYVIAFRGTLILRLRDLKLNLKFFVNELQESHRSQLAMRCVENFVDSNGSSNVWLAGHSLGSAIALIVGRNMMLKKNCCLEAYLFNPPYASLHIENLCTSMDEDMKHLVRIVRGIFKIGLAIAVEARINPQMQEQKADTFCLLSGWTPHLFVNPGDFICSEYIAYFKDHKLETAPEMRTLSGMSCTTINLVKHLTMGENLKDAMQFLPSADQILNKSRPHEKLPAANYFMNFLDAHGLCQWWDREVRCQSTRYVYPTTKDPQ
ncbi:hypothetical protein F2P56_031334 [Juglans regia]|uniref:GDSL esterase/lipase At4g10955-like isoform X1 n=2 Tax=Juglans regia TaxID=51240 RepID=A0A2I4FW43_JUGRE|nr:GDSL esterase/lipase At4g10955-like isoform X1 [Juglans regia]KAF5451031.1 hypothetical protein F2P56_031334 [Juglans regia]